MSEIVVQFNFLLAIGTIFMQIGIVLFLFLYFFKRDSPILTLIGTYGIHIVFLLSLGGVVLSLTYSEIFGFVPCGLCWLQRVFLYPQLILSGLALFKKERFIADYLISLSVVGVVIALYQHYLQMGGADLINCPAAAGDCAKRFLFEFGYITFPLMSFTVFALIIVVMMVVRRSVQTS
ncbi:disulfide bond formation protein B [Candidatus Kaiserbacteria bacterium]|nr:disulfide bond formation protein B [Candidatus Kaiserbacteria bacterium]